MKLNDLLIKDYVWHNVDLETNEDLFKLVYNQALKDGYVKESFLEAIEKREANFPTGLALENYAIAIPHTDPEHVKKEFISLVVPKKPLEFSRMDDPSEKVRADLVFLLALKKSQDHMLVLSDLMSLIQDEKSLEEMIKNPDIESKMKILKGED